MDEISTILTDDGIQVDYVSVGEGETILFFPGAFCRAEYYRRAISLLSKTNRVIAPRIPGFGGSMLPSDDWDFDAYGELFEEFVEKLELESITVIGHSFGGGIGMALAKQSKVVDILVLVDSIGVGFEGGLLRIIYEVFLAKSVRTLVYYQDRRLMAKIAGDFILWMGKHVHYLPRMTRIGRSCMLEEMAGFEEIRAETWIMWGKYDRTYAPDKARKLQSKIGGSTIVWVEGTHDWIFFEPEPLLRLLGSGSNKLT